MQNNERVVKRHDREANNYNSRNVRGINVAYMFKIPARISKWTSERSDETGRESERERERERKRARFSETRRATARKHGNASSNAIF